MMTRRARQLDAAWATTAPNSTLERTNSGMSSAVCVAKKCVARWTITSGSPEVMRTVPHPPRMGLRFVTLEGAGLTLVQRLIEASEAAPDIPTVPGYAPPAVEFDHGSVRVRLTAATATFFTYNPLLHVGVRGCFLPAEADVPLGTGYQLDIFDEGDRLLVRCKAKVAAKQDRWVGLRFLDVDRTALQALRAEVARLGAGSK